MDINYYVKIKKIVYPDSSLTSLIKGIVFRKNVNHKRMKTIFKSPKILILIGNLDFDENNEKKTFEEMVNNEKKEMKKLVEKIMKNKPDIIMVEK